ncbi:hypothetical protein TNCV_1750311 [Trichonephila clavipes]|nr:hypothetical protein TNCV_1750311 [Trichonephila clavipes]
MTLQCKSRFEKSVNLEIVRNVLRKHKYPGRVSQRNPYISKANRQARLAFTKKYKLIGELGGQVSGHCGTLRLSVSYASGGGGEQGAMAIPQTILCLAASLLGSSGSSFLSQNTPPLFEMKREWIIPEDEPVGVYFPYSVRDQGVVILGFSGQGIGSWQARYEFEPSTTKDPPFREAMHVKSVERSNLFPLVWCANNMLTKYQMIKFMNFCEVWFLPESVARVAIIVGDHHCHTPRHFGCVLGGTADQAVSTRSQS